MQIKGNLVTFGAGLPTALSMGSPTWGHLHERQRSIFFQLPGLGGSVCYSSLSCALTSTYHQVTLNTTASNLDEYSRVHRALNNNLLLFDV